MNKQSSINKNIRRQPSKTGSKRAVECTFSNSSSPPRTVTTSTTAIAGHLTKTKKSTSSQKNSDLHEDSIPPKRPSRKPLSHQSGSKNSNDLRANSKKSNSSNKQTNSKSTPALSSSTASILNSLNHQSQYSSRVRKSTKEASDKTKALEKKRLEKQLALEEEKRLQLQQQKNSVTLNLAPKNNSGPRPFPHQGVRITWKQFFSTCITSGTR